MEIYIPTTVKELSQRKLEEYTKFDKIIRLGRQNPIWFTEQFYGISLMAMLSWCRKNGRSSGVFTSKNGTHTKL